MESSIGQYLDTDGIMRFYWGNKIVIRVSFITGDLGLGHAPAHTIHSERIPKAVYNLILVKHVERKAENWSKLVSVSPVHGNGC